VAKGNAGAAAILSQLRGISQKKARPALAGRAFI